MKRFLKAVVLLAVLAVLTVLFFSLVKPLIEDRIGDVISDALTTPASTTEGGGQARVEYDLTVELYEQDAASGEYRLTQTLVGTLLHGASYEYPYTVPSHHYLDEEKSNYAVENAESDVTLTLYFACETCVATFSGGEGNELTSGSAYQILRKGQTPEAPTFSRYGYTLVGYDKQLEPIYENTAFTAVWTVTLYTVRLYATEETVLFDATFARRNDAPSCFERTFTVFDSFEIPTPTSTGYSFLSWNDAADGNGETYTSIERFTDHDLALYAIYSVKFYSISFGEVDGVSYPDYYLPYGTAIEAPVLSAAEERAGYGLNWYTDASYTSLYRFSSVPAENVTLYGRWDYETGTGFLDWPLDDLSQITIDSFEELLAFVDYVRFYDIQEDVTAEVTYDTYKNVISDLALCEQMGHFRANGAIGYSAGESTAYTHANAKCYVKVRVTTSFRDKEASLSTASNNDSVYTYLAPDVVGRGGLYRNFYIDSLPNTFSVTTTNQLQYVVEHGYRPLPVAGSDAERIYNAAKEVLNTILPADASDYEKIEAIFDYLVTKIEYDRNAVLIAETDASSWPYYDAYFLEGVFDNKKAVCDGIAKAFSLMCNIEGIPCVEVVGSSHAWNRVKLNNRWYVADPTFGNLHITGSTRTLVDHSHFLISDADKLETGYSTLSFPHIKAEESYEYFANKTATALGKSFDFVINSTEELALMLCYLMTLEDDLDGCSIDFVYAISGVSFGEAYASATKILQREGIRFRYNCSSYGASYNTVYKIVFLRT